LRAASIGDFGAAVAGPCCPRALGRL